MTMPEIARIEASPRSRGWTRHRRVHRLARMGFPALAGMDLGLRAQHGA